MNLIQRAEAKTGDLLRIIGILLAMQGVISQYFTALGVQPRVLTAIFGGLGIVMMISGKYIDSRSYTDIMTGGKQ